MLGASWAGTLRLESGRASAGSTKYGTGSTKYGTNQYQIWDQEVGHSSKLML
jgi:hypothetical protein